MKIILISIIHKLYKTFYFKADKIKYTIYNINLKTTTTT